MRFPFLSETDFDLSHKLDDNLAIFKPITLLCRELAYLRVAERELGAGGISL